MSSAAVCPLCQGAAAPLHDAREMMIGTRERFRYGECDGCGSLVLIDVPDDLGPYYPADYYSLRPLVRSRAPRRWLKEARAAAAARGLRRTATLLGAGKPPPWLRWIEVAGLDRSASICDIGCGRGELLFELANAGFAETVGIDPLVPESVHRDGVRIHRAEAGDVAGAFDLVMFNHSFEHLSEPLAALGAARRLLAPGGSLMLRTPVAGSWAWRHYGTNWVALDAPRHLFVPTLAGLEAALGAAGLEPYARRFDSTEMQFWRSEQYRADVALFEPGSHQLDPAGSPFSRRRLRQWRREAERLNRAGEGDTVAVFCRVPEPAAAA
jgi:SAM-dependent methyltransferase